MKTYKSAAVIMIRESFYALFMPVIVVVIGSFFTDNYLLLGAIGAAALLLYLYWALISSRVKFEIEGNELRYYRKGKIVQVFDLNQSSIRYSIRTKGTDSSIDFYITDYSKNDEEFHIDASALGANRFQKMFDDLKSVVETEETLEVLRG